MPVRYRSLPGGRRVSEAQVQAAAERRLAEDATADEILELVGSDANLARRAISTEEGRDKPRKTLLDKLRKVAGE